MPKLVAEDIPLLNSLLSDVFPGVAYTPAEMKRLRQEIAKVCGEMFLVYGDGEDQGGQWVEKVRTPASSNPIESSLTDPVSRIQSPVSFSHLLCNVKKFLCRYCMLIKVLTGV